MMNLDEIKKKVEMPELKNKNVEKGKAWGKSSRQKIILMIFT